MHSFFFIYVKNKQTTFGCFLPEMRSRRSSYRRWYIVHRIGTDHRRDTQGLGDILSTCMTFAAFVPSSILGREWSSVLVVGAILQPSGPKGKKGQAK